MLRTGGAELVQVSGEPEHAGQPEPEAVQAERPQGAGLEEAEEPPDRDVGRDTGDDAAHHGLAAYPVAERSEEVRELVQPRSADDGRSQEEGEPGGVLV